MRITEDTIPEGYAKDNPGIYVGHYELTDITTGVIAYGPTKIGKAKHLNAIFRGRNQGGADFIVDAFFPVPNHTEVESEIHRGLAPFKLPHPRRKELYRLSPMQMKHIILTDFPELKVLTNVQSI